MKKNVLNILHAMAFAFLCSATLPLNAQNADMKYLGGDISLLPDYESHGANYMDASGQKINDMLAFFKQKGWNTMRVRLFVNPENASQTHKNEGVRQNLEYVKKLGKRIKDAGLMFMLDFHYSDTWTDPGKHSTPSAWTSTNTDELATTLYNYTVSVLQELKDAGATPDFIQPGNEITYGMLWPTGHCYPNGGDHTGGTFANFAKYLKAGIKACREQCPNAKIVIQTEMSKATNVTSFYATLKNYTDDYDVIGLSYYPHYHGSMADLHSLLTTLETSYPTKKIEIVETGYFHKWYPSNATYKKENLYPDTDEGQRKFAEDLVKVLKRHANVDGLYWWFPEANEYGIDWTNAVTPSGWYNASLWDNETGKVLPAIDELKAFLGDQNNVTVPFDDVKPADNRIYDISGRLLPENARMQRGIYVKGRKKFVNR